MVQNLVNNLGNTDPELSEALQKISQHDNIPRKKPKYMVSSNIALFLFSYIIIYIFVLLEFCEKHSWPTSKS